MAASLRRLLSRAVGWWADRKLPRGLRAPLFRAFSALYGIDLSELRLPLGEHPSFGAFFVRRLRPGARPFPEDAALLPSPADGTLQAVDAVEGGRLLQAKGRRYSVAELVGEDAAELEGGTAWTIYLSPRDYHRVHAPCDCTLEQVRWIGGDRRPVKPAVLARRERVLAANERAVLRLATPRGPLLLVMVGALNVGRIRVVGLASGEPHAGGRSFARGDELARFELGSTVVLIAPPGGPRPAGAASAGAPNAGAGGAGAGASVRMGEPIGRWP
jgi:phosphatidylserine decarboxylase